MPNTHSVVTTFNTSSVYASEGKTHNTHLHGKEHTYNIHSDINIERLQGPSKDVIIIKNRHTSSENPQGQHILLKDNEFHINGESYSFSPSDNQLKTQYTIKGISNKNSTYIDESGQSTQYLFDIKPGNFVKTIQDKSGTEDVLFLRGAPLNTITLSVEGNNIHIKFDENRSILIQDQLASTPSQIEILTLAGSQTRYNFTAIAQAAATRLDENNKTSNEFKLTELIDLLQEKALIPAISNNASPTPSPQASSNQPTVQTAKLNAQADALVQQNAITTAVGITVPTVLPTPSETPTLIATP